MIFTKSLFLYFRYILILLDLILYNILVVANIISSITFLITINYIRLLYIQSIKPELII